MSIIESKLKSEKSRESHKSVVQTYARYKLSGVEWLGEIPEHWEIKRFKHIFREKKKTHNIELTCGSISFGKVVYKNDEKIPESTKRSYQVLNKGEFLINPLNLNYDLISLRIALSDKDVVVSSGYIIIQNVIELSKDYYKWLLHIFDVAFMKTLGAGVRQTLSITHIANSEFVFPPLPEQTAIANFLDDKTQKIDQAISIKEQQIELLKERKQILIHKAVTRGLDDTVKLKDSGVEWIGEIPEHWEVKRLKYFTNIQGGFAFNSNDFKDEGVQIIKIANTYMNRLSLDRQPTFVDESYLTSHKDWVVSKNDILMSLTGTLGKRDYGFAILIEDEAKYLLNQRVAKITVKKDFEPEYLLLLLQSDSYLNQLYCLPAGTKQANLSNDNVINIKTPIPPYRERKGISEYIETASQKIDTAISLKQQEIERLKEYKSSLINSVVTGKVKVC
ncbi:MAG TPA: restriction endonuclease subunit S [Dysgonamonadaceae bacterium]|nr:restriction endonuclease subunit S [Dysgonamonadaceae bacterium]